MKRFFNKIFNRHSEFERMIIDIQNPDNRYEIKCVKRVRDKQYFQVGEEVFINFESGFEKAIIDGFEIDRERNIMYAYMNSEFLWYKKKFDLNYISKPNDRN